MNQFELGYSSNFNKKKKKKSFKGDFEWANQCTRSLTLFDPIPMRSMPISLYGGQKIHTLKYVYVTLFPFFRRTTRSDLPLDHPIDQIMIFLTDKSDGSELEVCRFYR